MEGVGVVVGRFQTPELHAGHRLVLDEANKNHQDLLIFIGSAQEFGTDRNPLDCGTRQLMLRQAYPHAIILFIQDKPGFDIEWSKDLDTQIKLVFPGRKIMLYGSRDSFLRHYKGMFEFKMLSPHTKVSSTKLREACVKTSLSSSDFRHGVIYGIRSANEQGK